MTKEIKVKDNTYLFVEVPNKALHDRWFIVWNEDNNTFNVEFQTKKDNIYISLNTNKNCYIISTTKDIIEEQAESIVEKYINYETEHEQLLDGMYEDYLEKGNYWIQDSSGTKLWAFKTAKESLQSLIQANVLDINKNYLILEKNEQ